MSEPTPTPRPLVELAGRLQRDVHDRAVVSNPLFSRAHWEHHAGPDHPEVPDDDSYMAFEHCVHPDCQLARQSVNVLEAHDALVVALRALRAEALAIQQYIDTEASGLTNLRCFTERIQQARDALALVARGSGGEQKHEEEKN